MARDPTLPRGSIIDILTSISALSTGDQRGGAGADEGDVLVLAAELADQAQDGVVGAEGRGAGSAAGQDEDGAGVDEAVWDRMWGGDVGDDTDVAGAPAEGGVSG